MTLSGFLIDVSSDRAVKLVSIVDLDVDLGADAVDYKYVCPSCERLCDCTDDVLVLLLTRSHCRVWKRRCVNLKE